MIAITLFSSLGYEEALVPAGLLEVSLGEKMFGVPAVIYRSGWLYAGEGFRFLEDGREITGALNAGEPLSLTLRGDKTEAAVAVRPATQENGMASLSGVEGFSVGHASANEIVYKDCLVSRCHGRFSRDGQGGFVYTDMSANGSYVGGQFLRGSRSLLKEGEEVLVPPLMKMRIEGDTLFYAKPAGFKACAFEEIQEAEK